MSILSSIKKRGIWLIFFVMIFYVVIIIVGDLNKISESFLKLKPEFIFPVLALETISLIFRALRQRELLNKIGIKISILANLKIYFAAMSLVATPAGSGEVIKSHFIKENYGHNISKTLPIVFVERYHDLLAISTILLVSLLVVFSWPSAIILVISSVLLGGIFLIIRRQNLLMKVQQKMANIKFLSKLIPGSELNESLEDLSGSKIMAKAWSISLLSWILDALAVYVGFLAFDQHFEILETFQFYYTSIAYGAISLIPGGVGVTEGTLIGLLMSEGLNISLATAIVLFVRITTIWFATILGFISTRFVLKQSMIK